MRILGLAVASMACFTARVWGYVRLPYAGIDKVQVRRSVFHPLQMSQIDPKETKKKDMIYDSASGRLYEGGPQEGSERFEFTLKDQTTGKAILLTKAEKERIFLDSLRSYYFSGRQMMSDEDFDLLKEDLSWEGSELVYLTKNETLFLTAMSAYLRGQPMMSDAEFDELKTSLLEAGSKLAVSTEPKCYVDTGVCKVTWREDKLRKTVLYVPGAVLGIVLWVAAVFELIEPMRSVNPIITLVLGWPFAYKLTQTLTEKVLLNDPLIAQGPCPSCQSPIRAFFGDVLGVPGYKEEAMLKCPNCKTELSIRRTTLRVTTVPKA